MSILLINAPYTDIYGPIKEASGKYFPLGLGYIASYLIKKGFKVSMLDPEAQRLNSENIRQYIKEYKPKVVGLSCATPNFPNALKIAKIVKEESNALVVLGGIHASALPEWIIKKHSEIDMILTGEGEHTFYKLVDKVINNNNAFNDIDGLFYRNAGQIITSSTFGRIECLDDLPHPDRDLIDINLYRPHSHNVRYNKCSFIMTSRGCPYKCIFCASYLTLGKKTRFHSSEYVIEEIEILKKDYGIEQILIEDDTFTLDRERTIKICEELIEKKLNIKWFCFARVNTVDEELLKLMKKAGCFSIGYGIESGDEQILKNIKKGITLEQARQVLKISNKLGLKTQTFYVFGNPGETQHTIDKTINFAMELNSALAFFNILVGYPGTEIFNKYFDLEQIKNWEDFVAIGVNPTIEICQLNKKQIQKLIHKAYFKYYSRPSQIFNMLKHIKSSYEMKEYLKGGMALLKQMNLWKKLGNKK